MALIPCPSCAKTISDRAKACPHCGFDMTQPAPAETTKFCVECGGVLPEGVDACPHCGCPVEDEPAAPASAPVVKPAAEDSPAVDPAPATEEPPLSAFSFYEAPAEPEPVPVRETGFTEPTLLVAAPTPIAEPVAEAAPVAEPAPAPNPTPAPAPQPAPAPAPSALPTEDTPVPARPVNSLVSPDSIFLEMPRPNPKWQRTPKMELVTEDNKRIPVECSKVYKISTPSATLYSLEVAGRQSINRILLGAFLIILMGFIGRLLLPLLSCLSWDFSGVLHSILHILTYVLALAGAALLIIPREKLPAQLQNLLKTPNWLPGSLKSVKNLLPLSMLLLALVLFLSLVGSPIFVSGVNYSWYYDENWGSFTAYLCYIIPIAVLGLILLVRAIFFKTRLGRFPVVPGHRFRLYWADGYKLACEQLID